MRGSIIMLGMTLAALGLIGEPMGFGAPGPGLALPDTLVLDDGESLEKSQTMWEQSGVTVELSKERVAQGAGSLKVTFLKDKDWPGLTLKGEAGRPLDWHAGGSLAFEVFNPQRDAVSVTIRIDDANSQGFKDRYERCGSLWFPPNRFTRVEVALTNLLANNGRLLDPFKIVLFNLHMSRLTQDAVLYFDHFRLLPLPEQQRPEPESPAEAPRLLDGGEDPARSKTLWECAAATLEFSQEHATEGTNSLKITLAKNRDQPGVVLQGMDGRPMDWRGYRSLCFEVFNASPAAVPLSLRIEDVHSTSVDTSLNIADIRAAPGVTTPVRVAIWPLQTDLGFRMDKARLARLRIFVDKAAADRVLFLDNVRLEPDAEGMVNAKRIGWLPDQTPVSLAKALSEDPEIKAFVPIFKAIPPRRVAVIGHSHTMSARYATSACFFDIAAETVRLVNPGFEYQSFHSPGLQSTGALAAQLPNVLPYKPTDTYILVHPVFPAEQKLMQELLKAGIKVYRFDSVVQWGRYPRETTEAIRACCKENGVPFLELMARGWGLPGTQDWVGPDGNHMVTEGHLFYARELLKDWAKIYGAGGGSPPAQPTPTSPASGAEKAAVRL